MDGTAITRLCVGCGLRIDSSVIIYIDNDPMCKSCVENNAIANEFFGKKPCPDCMANNAKIEQITKQRNQAWLVAEHRERNIETEQKLLATIKRLEDKQRDLTNLARDVSSLDTSQNCDPAHHSLVVRAIDLIDDES